MNSNANDKRSEREAASRADPKSASVSFVTTEHVTLQSARTKTVGESTGRAAMFLGAVSAGLVALGLMATATRVGTAFYAFALVVLPTLAVVGLATFSRALQAGTEDFRYARRIARLRAYYFDNAPELVHYLASVPPEKRLEILGVWGGRIQSLRTVAGMVAVVSSVIAGSAVGLAVALASSSSLTIGFACGLAVSTVLVFVLLRREVAEWNRVANESVSDEQRGTQSVGIAR